MSRCGECKLGCNEIGVFYCEENLGYEQCIDRLQDALYSADRPQGEWIKHKEKTEINGNFIDFFPAEYECSNCGLREAHYFINSKPHNFCPNCGAKMKGADDEAD